MQPDLSEIQAHILEPYPEGHCARLAFFHFTDAADGRAWLKSLNDWIKFHDDEPKTPPVNVAFTYAGLAALEVAAAALDDFAGAKAFCQGMAARAAILGDPTSAKPPKSWTHPDKAVHAVVIVHVPIRATANAEVHAALRELGKAVRAYGGTAPVPPLAPVAVASRLLDETCKRIWRADDPSVLLLGIQDAVQPLTIDDKALELFGFRDGVSQPEVLSGSGPGAFFHDIVVGGPPSLLTNGSFLVIRRLEQELKKFWDAMAEQGAPSKTPQEMAALVMGRNLDGTTLGGLVNPQDEMVTFDPKADPDGARCPFMSHARRANPRIDATAGANPRLLRRSLSFIDGPSERGQLFMAYNADIVAQFEFIQSRWLQRGTAVGGRTLDQDVIAGQGTDTESIFRAGASGDAAHRPFVAHFASFVAFDWGEYFFAPSRDALQRLGEGREVDGRKTDRDLAGDLTLDPAADGAVDPALHRTKSLATRVRRITAWLDDPEQALRFWTYVRGRPGRVLRLERTPGTFTTFVADGRSVEAILGDDGHLFSVEGYAERMRQSAGRFFLGMDPYTKPYTDSIGCAAIIPAGRWPGRPADAVDAVLQKNVADIQVTAYRTAQYFLAFSRLSAADAPEPDPTAPVNFDVLMAVTLDAVCTAFFGVPGLGAGSLVSWAADVTTYYFRAGADAIDAGKGRQSGLDYVAHVGRLVDQASEPPPGGLSDVDLAARETLVGILGILRNALGPAATQEDLTRNLVGVMTGSLSATIALFTGALVAKAAKDKGALLVRDLPGDVSGSFPRYQAFVERPLLEVGRGGPDHLYRHYKGEVPWAGPQKAPDLPAPAKASAAADSVQPGDVVVCWVGGAARDLKRGSLFFGGSRHHCPGEQMGKAIIDGVLQALGELTHPTFDPVTLTIRSDPPSAR